MICNNRLFITFFLILPIFFFADAVKDKKRKRLDLSEYIIYPISLPETIINKHSPLELLPSWQSAHSPKEGAFEIPGERLRTIIAADREIKDCKAAAPRLAFSEMVKDSQRVSRENARKMREKEEKIIEAQKLVVGCPVS